MIAPTLVTPRLTLRAPQARDAEPFIGFFTGARAGSFGMWMPRPDAWRLFATAIGHWTLRGFGMWTVTRSGDDTPLGLVGCLRMDDWPENEIGWFLWDGAEGQGIATEAALAARTCAYDRFGWTTAVSYIDASNTRSVRVAERLGATPEPGAPHPNGDAPTIVMRHPAPGTA
ncbi:MAG: GNAT family N-acetyltransferase [Gemmobacter sp.]